MKSSPHSSLSFTGPGPVAADEPDPAFLAWPYLKALFAIDAAQSLVVHDDPRAFEENSDSAPAKARPFLRDAAQSIANQRVVGFLARFVLHRRARAAREPARLPLAQPVSLKSLHRFFTP